MHKGSPDLLRRARNDSWNPPGLLIRGQSVPLDKTPDVFLTSTAGAVSWRGRYLPNIAMRTPSKKKKKTRKKNLPSWLIPKQRPPWFLLPGAFLVDHPQPVFPLGSQFGARSLAELAPPTRLWLEKVECQNGALGNETKHQNPRWAPAF